MTGVRISLAQDKVIGVLLATDLVLSEEGGLRFFFRLRQRHCFTHNFSSCAIGIQLHFFPGPQASLFTPGTLLKLKIVCRCSTLSEEKRDKEVIRSFIPMSFMISASC